MKLTKTEIKALNAMLGWHVGAKFMPLTVQSLVQKGLAERTFGVVNYSPRYRITEAGKAALEGGE